MEPRALLQLAFFLVNLLGTEGPCTGVCLLIIEIVLCDVFLKSHQIKLHGENISEDLTKTLFSFINAGTTPVAKYYKVLVLIAFQILMTLKFLLNLRTNLITQAYSLVLTFTPQALNF